MAVDIGYEATDRGAAWGAEGSTLVAEDKPASIAGTITSVDIWAAASLENAVVGTFYTTNGNTLRCRDSAVIGAVASGAKRTFTKDSGNNPLAVAVEIGDYIGIYSTAGQIERDTSGSNGMWYIFSESIDPGDETEFTLLSADGLSLGGYITLSGWTGKVSGVTNPAKVMGIAKANIGKVCGVS